jgi:hypothetical protein
MASVATTVPAQLLKLIKERRFSAAARMFAPGVDFQAWTPVGHWIATDGATAARILEVWYTPGNDKSATIVESHETANAKSAMLEFEILWKVEPDDQPRTLRQLYLLTLNKDGRITHARVYCAGLHTEFPEVDLEKQRRAKGIGGPKLSNAPKMVAVRAS